MNKLLCNYYQNFITSWGDTCVWPTPRTCSLQRNALFAMMPETAMPEAGTSDMTCSSTQPSPPELYTGRNDLSNLTQVVVKRVLASFTQPLNVVPISLHLVRMLEQFPAAPDNKSVDNTETSS